MTCIVGIENDGLVTIGGDSAGVAGYSISHSCGREGLYQAEASVPHMEAGKGLRATLYI
jgi:hypothetical protein